MTAPSSHDISPTVHSGSAASYDAVPYDVAAFRQTDPSRLAVVAHLFGLAAAPPHAARVLELGRARGGNLIPMAAAYPNSQFIGIDFSERQINEGQAVVDALALPNLQLRHLSITDVSPSLGMFDYILAHGIYSWVPPHLQSKILDICRNQLAPAGVAYISYNTFPGWHGRGAIRDMLCYHTRDISDPRERIRRAREFLVFLGNSASTGTSDAALFVREINAILKKPDGYLAHEYLEDFNLPLYFHEFVARAQEKKLQYLAEAEIASMLPGNFGPETESRLVAMSAGMVQLEQNMDFLCNRLFRQSLLCHAAAPLDRALRPNAVTGFHVASPLKPESTTPDIASDKTETFAAESRPPFTTGSQLLKAALLCLAESWPLPLAFAALLEQARTRLQAASSEPLPQAADQSPDLAQALLQCYTTGVVEFTASPPAFTLTVSDRPLTGPYVRFRARKGAEATNLRLENIALTAASRLVLAHLDGAHDRAALIALIANQLNKTAPGPASAARSQAIHERTTEYIDYILPNFARSAWLIA